ncbi:hypothetical protein [Aeromonas sp. 97A]|uniref:hypothetical protein n=1 Tax=Aeromonas sp. 97A TaxID=3452731 RepID=UPI003F79A8A2
MMPHTMADNKAHPLAQHIPTGKGDDNGKHPPGLVDKQSAQGERKHQGDMHRLRHLGTMHSDLMQLPQQIDQIEDHIESDHSNHPHKDLGIKQHHDGWQSMVELGRLNWIDVGTFREEDNQSDRDQYKRQAPKPPR